MARNLKVIVIDQDVDNRGLISYTLQETSDSIEVLAETDNLTYGYELVRQNRPDIVFIDLSIDTAKSLEVVSRISTYFKEIFIVVSGNEVSLELIKAAMQAGAREYLERPLKKEDIASVYAKHSATLLTDTVGGDQSGRIITVFSNKGGLGKTTVAVNLAMALSSVVGKPVALVDLNLQLGDITTFLDIEPKQTIVDIAQNIGRVDAAYLESSLAEFSYGDAKVYVLADPLHAEEAEEVTSEQINAVLTVLRATFEYVVIDTTTSFDSKTLAALDLADYILLISIINLPCIRSSQRLLSLFDRLGYDEQKVKLIVNRYIPDEEITVDDVEDTLEHPVFWKIPNNYPVVMAAINRGIPIMAVENPNKNLEKNFTDLAYKLSGILAPNLPAAAEADTPVAESRKGLLGILGKK